MRNLEIIDPEQVTFLGELFSKAAERMGVDVPHNFLPLSLNAMRHLADSGRSNVVYDLCQGLGTFREDGSDSVFPAKRLICGLVEYIAKFFNAGEAQNVSCVKLESHCLSNPLFAQMTLKPGVRVCTHYLATSGSICMEVLCGKWRSQSKKGQPFFLKAVGQE